MSISGKCDFEDTVALLTPDKILKEYKVFVTGHTVIPLAFKTPEDFIPYYPHLVLKMAGGEILLSERSFIDTEEEAWLTGKLENAKRYWRKCKREKVPFDKDKALERITWIDTPQHYEIELINRVAELGLKATIQGLHDKSHDRKREELFNLMIANGWDKDISCRWVYGWERFLRHVQERENDGSNQS